MSARVLIIDDSELVLQMLQMACEQAGYTVDTATHFADVAAIVSRETPDVIISDLNLPDLPEKDPVSALRQMEGVSEVPIILVSGRDQAELEAEAERLGASGAVSKDVGMAGMSQRLPELLQEVL